MLLLPSAFYYFTEIANSINYERFYCFFTLIKSNTQ